MPRSTRSHRQRPGQAYQNHQHAHQRGTETQEEVANGEGSWGYEYRQGRPHTRWESDDGGSASIEGYTDGEYGYEAQVSHNQAQAYGYDASTSYGYGLNGGYGYGYGYDYDYGRRPRQSRESRDRREFSTATIPQGPRRRASPSYDSYDRSSDPALPSPSRSYHDRATRSASPPRRSPTTTRMASPPPPAPPPAPPRSPSPTYIETTLLPSTRVESRDLSRKLLVLDLNGTLLIRGAYSEPRQQWMPTKPRLRAVHPRPYMPSFRRYLFHPRTREWLDVMVWSSAQPHSVADMVDKCFGLPIEDESESKIGSGEDKEAVKTYKDLIVAIWARDTLGLTSDEYNRKTQTTKDLTKPWAHLNALRAPTSSPPPSSPPPSSPKTEHPKVELYSHTRRSPTPPLTTSPGLEQHSAKTTLLLDDSPLKARLQPYNHLCVPEYGAELRKGDLKVLEGMREREREQIEEGKATGEEEKAEGDIVPDESSKEKKKKKKKRKTAEEVSAENNDSAESSASGEFDLTLLAIVGILDEVKRRGNVAAWVRSGGLWGEVGVEEVDGKVHAETEAQIGGKGDGEGETQEVPLDGSAGNDLSSRASVSLTSGDAAPTPVDQEPQEPAQKLWFESPENVRAWAERGKEALAALGIPVLHGVDR